ncbi:MAG: AAA family ATPase, partial [Blastocatellia bacterium]
IVCGEPKRVYVDQSRLFPVLRMPYGEVAFPQWSASARRIIGFAYMLVWAWYEHVEASRLRGQKPVDNVVLIVDEIEAHLHPMWQRTILPALMGVMTSLQANVDVQMFSTTHSPLILASIESQFSAETDKLFWFDMDGGKVSFQDRPWAIQGDVVGWLTSDIFGLRQARSREAEDAIEAAEAFMRGDRKNLPKGLSTKHQIHEALKRSLAGLDPFWPRWIVEAKPEPKR